MWPSEIITHLRHVDDDVTGPNHTLTDSPEEVMLTERDYISLDPIGIHNQKIPKMYLYVPMLLS